MKALCVNQDQTQILNTGPLGLSGDYAEGYDLGLLHPMLRKEGRRAVGLNSQSSFLGRDLWTGYEFSWLDPKGKPVVAGLILDIDCGSRCIVESKSMKLYLNGFAQTVFTDTHSVRDRLAVDLKSAFKGEVDVSLIPVEELAGNYRVSQGICLDGLDIETREYQRTPDLLVQKEGSEDELDESVTEVLYSHLFRSLCPVTAQPDWATVIISYLGKPIDHAGLLRYLISYRSHQAFHETTIERIFVDIMAAYQPKFLSVNGRFQRRGGLDINPFRSSERCAVPSERMARQ